MMKMNSFVIVALILIGVLSSCSDNTYFSEKQVKDHHSGNGGSIVGDDIFIADAVNIDESGNITFKIPAGQSFSSYDLYVTTADESTTADVIIKACEESNEASKAAGNCKKIASIENIKESDTEDKALSIPYKFQLHDLQADYEVADLRYLFVLTKNLVLPGSNPERYVLFALDYIKDSTQSVIESISIKSSAANNNWLTQGDEVRVIVSITDTVQSYAGTFINLLIGSKLVKAQFKQANNKELVFSYRIQSGYFDGDGISVPDGTLLLGNETHAYEYADEDEDLQYKVDSGSYIDLNAAMNKYGGSYNAPTAYNHNAFAVLDKDNTIQAWGMDNHGGKQADVPTGEYTQIYTNMSAFAALTQDKRSIQVWGHNDYGGKQLEVPSIGVGDSFNTIYSNGYAFAALTKEGVIQVWGHTDYGGKQSGVPAIDVDDVYMAVYSNDKAFAALTKKGKIKVWGLDAHGGSGAPTGSGYTQIYATGYAFAALAADGSISVWGNDNYGGKQVDVPAGKYTNIYSNGGVFAALKDDGSIKVWGHTSYGGNQSQVPVGNDYIEVFSTSRAFAALTDGGSIKVWGDNSYGGNQTEVSTASGYTNIYATRQAFAALKDDGSIAAWGDDDWGGKSSWISDGCTETYLNGYWNGTKIQGAPSGNEYKNIYSNRGSFAAITADGVIKAWGKTNSGGCRGLSGSGYSQIYSTNGVFAALTADSAIKVWGFNGYQNQGNKNVPAGTGHAFNK
jgi:hypothetical protein